MAAIEFGGLTYAPMEVIVDPRKGFWLFGYGSVVWKVCALLMKCQKPSSITQRIPHEQVDFEHDDRKSGFVEGFARRFWQASPDHRGIPERPGRVCTLLSAADAEALEPGSASGPNEYKVHGCAYHVPANKGPSVMEGLLFREKAGYTQRLVDVTCTDGSTVQALVFVGEPAGEHFAGYQPGSEIAEIISKSAGPSGPNLEYFLKLYAALETEGQLDSHLRNIYTELERLGAVLHADTGVTASTDSAQSPS